jgi:3'-5' exoribonuclease
MTREAFILYYADELDSKIAAFDRIEEKEQESGKTWSNYVKLLDRFLYFGDSAV